MLLVLSNIPCILLVKTRRKLLEVEPKVICQQFIYPKDVSNWFPHHVTPAHPPSKLTLERTYFKRGFGPLDPQRV